MSNKTNDNLATFDSDHLTSHLELDSKTEATTSNELDSLFEKHLFRFSSAHTRRAYRNDWIKFKAECFSWLQIELNKTEEISEELVLAWLRLSESQAENSTEGLTARELAKKKESRKRLLACLSSFCSTLSRAGKIESNPLSTLPKETQTLSSHMRSEALNQREMQDLLELVTLRKQKANSVKQNCSADLYEVLIWTLLTVGMRVSELCHLLVKDFQVSMQNEEPTYQLHIALKGGDSHSPYIHKKTGLLIQKYIRSHRHTAKPEDVLFVNATYMMNQKSKPKPLSQFGVYRIVEKVALEAGIDKKISPHSLRASLATALIQQNVPIAHVKDLLGHGNIQTTNSYLKRANAEAESATLQLDINKLFNEDPEALVKLEGKS